MSQRVSDLFLESLRRPSGLQSWTSIVAENPCWASARRQPLFPFRNRSRITSANPVATAGLGDSDTFIPCWGKELRPLGTAG
jgi:hypothetical protein